MIKAIAIVILAGLTFLQGLSPRWMAPKPISPSVLQSMEAARTKSGLGVEHQRRRSPFIPLAPTPTRQHRKVTPEPNPPPVEPPTPMPEEPQFECPPVGDCANYGKDYKPICFPICEADGYDRCGKLCNDCWKGE